MLAALQDIIGMLLSSLREGDRPNPDELEAEFEAMLRELETLHQDCLAALDELQRLAAGNPTEAEVKEWVASRPVRESAVIHLVEALTRAQRDRKLRSRIGPGAARFLDAVCDYLGFPVLSSRYTYIRSLIRFETWLSFDPPSPRLVREYAAEMARDLRAGWDEVREQYSRVRSEAARV